MSLNDHISDKASWRCLEQTDDGEQCARWAGHTPYEAANDMLNHMSYVDVIGAFTIIIGVYNHYDPKTIIDMMDAQHEKAKLWYLRATLIYNSKVYIQGVDDA